MASDTLTLKYPVDAQGQHVETLEVKRPTAGMLLDARKTRGDDADKELALFATLTGQPPAVLRALDIADYAALQKLYEGFLS